MPDTLPNILLPSDVWVDLHAAAGEDSGTPLAIENVGSADVFYTEQVAAPAQDHNAYRVVRRGCCATAGTSPAPSKVWAISFHGSGKLNVRVDPGRTRPAPARNAGTPFVAELTAVAQSSAQYGVIEEVTSVLVDGVGATAGANAEGQYFAACGASGGRTFGSVFSRLAAPYRAGQGLVAVFTAVFDENSTPGNILRAGLVNATDTIGVGRVNNVDQVIYTCCGTHAIWDLTYTSGAAGAETVQVTVEGTVHNVDLTAGSSRDAAAQTARQLGVAIPLWRFQQVGDTVVARAIVARPEAGAFAFSGPGAASASWTVVSVGVRPVDLSIPRSNWSQRTSVLWLDLSKENQYRIRMQYLGSVFLEVQHPDTGDFVTFHVLDHPNSSTRPLFTQPSFRIGWVAVGDPSLVAHAVRGSEYAVFVPGEVLSLLAPEIATGTALSLPTVGHTHVLTVRNRQSFGGIVNLGQFLPRFITATTDSSKGANILIVINAVFDVDLTFDFQDEGDSIGLVSTDTATFISGDVTGQLQVAPGLVPLDFRIEDVQAAILPGDSLSIVMQRRVGGSGTEGTVTLTWKEVL